MVRSLGVKVGGRPAPPAPFEHLRSALAGARPDAFEGSGGTTEAAAPGCPFAASLGDPAGPATSEPNGVTWEPEAEARLERVPSFIRPMARRSIERYAEGKGYRIVTGAVMDEARAVFGM
jgi:hypothetical protein